MHSCATAVSWLSKDIIVVAVARHTDRDTATRAFQAWMENYIHGATHEAGEKKGMDTDV